MAWRNTADSFGLATRLLHWAMAAAILFMLALGTWIEGMEPGLSNLWLYALHKTVGLILLGVTLPFVVGWLGDEVQESVAQALRTLRVA